MGLVSQVEDDRRDNLRGRSIQKYYPDTGGDSGTITTKVMKMEIAIYLNGTLLIEGEDYRGSPFGGVEFLIDIPRGSVLNYHIKLSSGELVST